MESLVHHDFVPFFEVGIPLRYQHEMYCVLINCVVNSADVFCCVAVSCSSLCQTKTPNCHLRPFGMSTDIFGRSV